MNFFTKLLSIFICLSVRSFHSFFLKTVRFKEISKMDMIKVYTNCSIIYSPNLIILKPYCRRQAKWMRRRFVVSGREAPPVYRVDSTRPELWQENCYLPAQQILQESIYLVVFCFIINNIGSDNRMYRMKC